MKSKIILIIIINLILVGEICNYINKENLNNQKQIIKEMEEAENDNNITLLNESHEKYVSYVDESKKKIEKALNDIGIETSNEESFETMARIISNINPEISFESLASHSQTSGFVAGSHNEFYFSNMQDYDVCGFAFVGNCGNINAAATSLQTFKLYYSDDNINWNLFNSGTRTRYTKNIGNFSSGDYLYIKGLNNVNSYPNLTYNFSSEYEKHPYWKLDFNPSDNETNINMQIHLLGK